MDISLNSHEARVFGVLVEKAFTTPDQYPLSMNGIANGCNQKSNRDPVVDFSEPEVRIALQGLRMKGLAGGATLAGSRVEKWRHNAKDVLKLENRDLAVLTELLLRGPQTAGELRSRAKRMRDIPDLGVLSECLERLQERGLIRELSGGRAPRFTQLLCGHLDPDGPGAPGADAAPAAPASAPAATTAASPPPDSNPALDARVDALESKVAELEFKIERLLRGPGA